MKQHELIELIMADLIDKVHEFEQEVYRDNKRYLNGRRIEMLESIQRMADKFNYLEFLLNDVCCTIQDHYDNILNRVVGDVYKVPTTKYNNYKSKKDDGKEK